MEMFNKTYNNELIAYVKSDDGAFRSCQKKSFPWRENSHSALVDKCYNAELMGHVSINYHKKTKGNPRTCPIPRKIHIQMDSYFYEFLFSLALPHIEALNSRSAHPQTMVISPTENEWNSRHLGTNKAHTHISLTYKPYIHIGLGI